MIGIDIFLRKILRLDEGSMKEQDEPVVAVNYSEVFLGAAARLCHHVTGQAPSWPPCMAPLCNMCCPVVWPPLGSQN